VSSGILIRLVSSGIIRSVSSSLRGNMFSVVRGGTFGVVRGNTSGVVRGTTVGVVRGSTSVLQRSYIRTLACLFFPGGTLPPSIPPPNSAFDDATERYPNSIRTFLTRIICFSWGEAPSSDKDFGILKEDPRQHRRHVGARRLLHGSHVRLSIKL
jgi:hypothetical protein